MSDASQQLFEKALQLPVNERAELASRLLASVENEPEADIDAAWAKEIERRLDGDRSHDRPWAEVRAEVSAKYGYK